VLRIQLSVISADGEHDLGAVSHVILGDHAILTGVSRSGEGVAALRIGSSHDPFVCLITRRSWLQ
jgi:hypothetical protein